MSLISKKNILDPLLIKIKHICVNLTPLTKMGESWSHVYHEFENDVFWSSTTNIKRDSLQK